MFRPGRERQLYEAVLVAHRTTPDKPDLAYIIGDIGWKYQRPKSRMGRLRRLCFVPVLPSQMVTKQLLRMESQFRYAIPNIALSTLAKLGGVPWLVKRTSELTGSGDRGRHHRRYGHVRQDPPRLLGYAICMLSTGPFLDLDFFGVASTQESSSRA